MTDYLNKVDITLCNQKLFECQASSFHQMANSKPHVGEHSSSQVPETPHLPSLNRTITMASKPKVQSHYRLTSIWAIQLIRVAVNTNTVRLHDPPGKSSPDLAMQ